MKPPLFRDLSFEAAKAAAAAEKKWLLLDFTADQCGPCKNMDATTWLDPSVVDWVAAHAVAIQVDVDKDAVAKQFIVRSMPTFVVMDGDEELDRSSGTRAAPKLLEWLEALRVGRTEIDALREASGTDIHARMWLAHGLLERGQADAAAVEAIWVWDHCLDVDRSWIGVRFSFLVNQLKGLAAASAFAKTELTKRRDAALEELTAARPTRDQVSEFTALNQVLDDSASTLAWFDSVKPSAVELDQDRSLVEVLRRADRWADLGSICRSPVERLERDFDHLQHMVKDLPEGMDPGYLFRSFRAETAMLIRALRESGREDDETAVRLKAVQLDPSPEMKEARTGALTWTVDGPRPRLKRTRPRKS